MVDASAGLRGEKGVTAFPVPIAQAASFEAALVKNIGTAIGAEGRAKGYNNLLGARTRCCPGNWAPPSPWAWPAGGAAGERRQPRRPRRSSRPTAPSRGPPAAAPTRPAGR
nr:hypothetical protein [Streptomyces sp. BA2]